MNQKNQPENDAPEQTGNDIEEVKILGGENIEAVDNVPQNSPPEPKSTTNAMKEEKGSPKAETSKVNKESGISKVEESKRKREIDKVDKAKTLTKKMTYIILFEGVLILLSSGLIWYQLFNLDTTQTKLRQAKSDLGAATSDNKGIMTERDNARKNASDLNEKLKLINEDNSALKNESEKYKNDWSNLDLEYKNLVQSKGEIEKQLKITQQQLNEEVNKAGGDNKELSQKLALLQQEYDQLKIELETKISLIKPKKVKFEMQYGEYVLRATKMIETLKNFQSTLIKGLDSRKFARDFDQVKFTMDEFRVNTITYSKLISFQLIISAFNAYQGSEECWKKISQATLPNEVGAFRDKVIKFEQPIKEYRPWVDAIQISWQTAQYYLTAAEYVIQNHDDVDSIQCPVCQDKYSLICPKCGGSGECYLCKGRGQNEKADNSICLSCEGLGKCSLCKGKKEIPCPILILIPSLKNDD